MKQRKESALCIVTRKTKLMLYLLIMGVLMTACGGGDQYTEAASSVGGANDDYGYSKGDYNDFATEETESFVASNPPGQEEQLDQTMELDRKLIKNAHLNFQTDSLENRKKIVDNAVKVFSAYVEHEEQYGSYDRETVTTTVRVPSQNFDGFMEAVCIGVGTFDSKTIQVDDVTEEYVDVEARINTKKELKKRFIALLDKAETIKKIMEVEREIAALQAEIESYEGRLKYLSGSVKYATVDISYYRTIEVPTEFDNKFENAFSNGWQGSIWFFVGLVSIWPFLLILIVTLIIVRIRLKKRKAKIKR